MASPRVIVQAGLSRLEAEEPDLVIYRLCGVLQGEELQAMRDAEGSWNEGKPSLLVLVDITHLQNATMEARKISTQPPLGTKIRAIALFGGSRTIRVLADLSMRALRLLSRERVNLRFFEDETTALEWLYSQRPVLAAQL